MTHAELVIRAERWLRNFAGCSIVVTEISCVSRTMEIPDAIGWREGMTVLVECKTSRADFLADRKKAFRLNPDRGMGTVRYFMAPAGLIRTDELPTGWGLIEVAGKVVSMVAGIHPKKTWGEGSAQYVFGVRAMDAEVALLLSCMNRVRKTLGEPAFRAAMRTRLAPQVVA